MADRNAKRRNAALAFFNRSQSTPKEGETRNWYKIVSNQVDDVAEIFIYDEIGMWGTSAQNFAIDLALIKANTINVRINSPGGSVFDGYAIYSLLANHPAKVIVYVDGWAASIASVIMCAGDEINIAESAYVMIHKPWSFAMGTADDMRAEADILDGLQETIQQIYVDRTGGDAKAIAKQVEAETWFKGQEAVDAGFADKLIPNKKKPDTAEPGQQDSWEKPSAKMGADFFATIFSLPEEVRKALSVEKVEAEDEAFDFSKATPREAEAFLRANGATHRQAKEFVTNHLKQPEARDEPKEDTAAKEKLARDEQAKSAAADKSRDETIKAIESLVNAVAIRQAASYPKKP